MTTAQRDAHMRLLQSLPVHTHSREEPQEVNKYTGKPLTHDNSRGGRLNGRRNTWIGTAPNPK